MSLKLSNFLPVSQSDRLETRHASLIGMMALLLIVSFHSIHAYAQESTSNQSDTSSDSDVESEADRREFLRADSIDRITRFMDMGSTANLDGMIERHLRNYPDDALGYGQLARLIMKGGTVSADNMLGYRMSKDADARATSNLIKALELAPDNNEERSRLGYLHAVQGRFDEAQEAFDKVRQGQEMPAWINYNEAILAIGQNQFSKAAELLQPLTSKRPSNSDNKPWNIYRSAWSLRTRLALAHPDTDPVPAVSSGKMRRIPIGELYDTAIYASSSDKPLIIFISSSDSGCGPCVTDVAGLNETADSLGNHYDLLYTSIEPWNDIKKHSIAQRAFNFTGVPSQIIMYKGKHMITTKGTLAPNMFSKYIDAQQQMVDGVHEGNQVKSYEELMEVDINAQVSASIGKQENFSAAAIAIEGRQWISGIVGGRESQAQAQTDAMERCARNVESRGMEVQCSLWTNP